MFPPKIFCVNFNLKKHLTINLKMFIISNVGDPGGITFKIYCILSLLKENKLSSQKEFLIDLKPCF
jgi:hypothetical protein